jgi:hypothetical protein
MHEDCLERADDKDTISENNVFSSVAESHRNHGSYLKGKLLRIMVIRSQG